MPTIHLETKIEAPIERVFDLARSIDAHSASTAPTREIAIEGVTTGLIEKGEEVEWEATHFFIRQRLRSRITEMNRPNLFIDEMVFGAFHSMKHWHHFSQEKDSPTLMRDEFHFHAPLGLLGRIAEGLFLTSYLRRFLKKRNLFLKNLCEGSEEAWKKYLPEVKLPSPQQR